jgi:hypothetical protein
MFGQLGHIVRRQAGKQTVFDGLDWQVHGYSPFSQSTGFLRRVTPLLRYAAPRLNQGLCTVGAELQ